MNTHVTHTDITAKWRDVVIGAVAYPGADAYRGSIDPVAVNPIHAKFVTTATNGRPTRRGAPPH